MAPNVVLAGARLLRDSHLPRHILGLRELNRMAGEHCPSGVRGSGPGVQAMRFALSQLLPRASSGIQTVRPCEHSSASLARWASMWAHSSESVRRRKGFLRKKGRDGNLVPAVFIFRQLTAIPVFDAVPIPLDGSCPPVLRSFSIRACNDPSSFRR